ncbi:MAG: sodium:solute symporter family transporter [Clostridium sp.]
MVLSKIDVLIIVTYMVLMIVIGYFLGKNNESQEDYFLANRSMPWLPVGLSIAATMISCNSFIGGPGWGYESGLLPFMQNISVPLSLLIGLTVFMPFIYSLKLVSIYEYIELRLGKRTRLLTVLAFIINSLIQVSSMVFIPALVLERFTGIKMKYIIPIIVVTAIIYTLLGGIKAVIWTDAIQILVIWGGVIGGVIYIFSTSGIGFFETVELARQAGKLHAIDFSLMKSLLNENGAIVALIGGSVMWLRYFTFDQAQVQRMNTSKSLKDLKKSFVVSGILMNLLFFIFIFLGTLLFVQFDGSVFRNTNDVMITFIEKLPVGLIGILLAGLFAAAMSSVDSILNSMSTVFIKDIYEKHINKNNVADLKMTMLISAMWGILIVIITYIAFSGTTKSILEVIGSYISLVSGPSCGIFLLALLTKKANDKGTFYGGILGFTFVLVFDKYVGITWMWNALIGALATIIFGYVLSLFFKSEKRDVEKYTIQGYRKKVLLDNIVEDGVSHVPFKMDKYSYSLLGFFIVQFVILMIIK